MEIDISFVALLEISLKLRILLIKWITEILIEELTGFCMLLKKLKMK